MVLPQSGDASDEDVNSYYGHHGYRRGSAARDVSWHPHYPVLASTSFDSTVKIWTLQNRKEKEPVKVKQKH